MSIVLTQLADAVNRQSSDPLSEKRAKYAADLLAKAPVAAQQFIAALQAFHAGFWRNSDPDLTPTQLMAALGTKAKALFADYDTYRVLFNGLLDAAQAANPGTDYSRLYLKGVPAQYQVSFADDGKGAVTEVVV